MHDHDGQKANDEQQRVTRRAALAAGAGVYAGSMLWGAAALAATSTPADLLAHLRHLIRSSTVEKQLKASLLATAGRADANLKARRNAAARTALQDDLIPALRHNKGRHRLGVKQANQWIAQAEQIVAKLSGLGAPKNGGGVYAFNCFNEPINRFTVAGASLGSIPAWSAGNGGEPTRYTPAARRVARTKSGIAGQFALGDNAVSIEWDSFSGTTTVKIPDPQSGISFEDDLVLFVAVNQATLQSTRGFVLSTFKIALSG